MEKKVFPTCVGMIRPLARGLLVQRSVPHLRGDDPGASILAPNKSGTFILGDRRGTKPSLNAKGVGLTQSNPLKFLVLPMRFERMAYRLGGDFLFILYLN